MKILLATSSSVPNGGGISSYAQELIKILGTKNSLYLLTDSNEKDVNGFVMTISNYEKNIFSYRYSTQIIELINSISFDVIINSNSSLVAICSPFLNAPLISISHFVDGMLAINAGYNNRYISKIISLSYYGKNFIERTFKIRDKNKVEVVYNSVENNYTCFDQRKCDAKVLNIVYPGGSSIKKSPDIVLQTARLLLKTTLDFHFYWLGDTSLPIKQISKYKTISKLLNADRRMTFTGKISREEAEKIIDNANIFLLPSRGEGCPISLLEAMRNGCIPIVSDAHHGSREILQNGDFGIIVPQNNVLYLYNTLVDILENHTKYIQNYEKTSSFSRENLSSDIWKAKMSTIIFSALGGNKAIKSLTKQNYFKSVMGYQLYNYSEYIKSKFKSIFYWFKFNFVINK